LRSVVALTRPAAGFRFPPQELHMNDKLPFNPTTDVDDQSKAHTPDKRRNDHARWKYHDMPDDGDGPKAVPEDYERPDPDPTGRR